MRLEGAVFDFDGTLFDSMPVWDTVGEVYLRALGIQPHADLHRVLKVLSLDQSARYLKKTFDIPLSERRIVGDILDLVAQAYRFDILPKPGAEAFLRALAQRNVRMCIATAADRALVEAALRRCRLDDLFARVLTCAEAGHGKDEPVIFRRALDCLGTGRAQTMVFEDAYHAARTARGDGFPLTAVFDPSESQQDALRSLCSCYLTGFDRPEPFWALLDTP